MLRSEEGLRHLVESIPDVLWTTEEDGATAYISPNVERLLGFTAAEIYERGDDLWYGCIHPDDRDRVLTRYASLFAEPGIFDLEYRMRRRDSRWVWINDRGRIAFDEDGRRFAHGLLTDITARKHAEEQLKKHASLLGATLEATADGILVVDLKGRMVQWNKRFSLMWGIPDDVLAGRDERRALEAAVERLKEPEEFLRRVKEIYADPEGASLDTISFVDGRVFERASQPEKIDGLCVGRVWSFSDVTGRLRLEAQLLQAQKMEAVGRLAGGIAHDFNNLITAISGYSELVFEALPPDSCLREMTQEVIKAGNRAATLTRQLLAFSRKQVLQPTVLNLNDVVGDLCKMLPRMLGEDVNLETLFAPNLGSVRVDRGQVEQVLMNLAVNARDAMEKGGTLIIDTRNADLEPAFCQSRPGSHPGPHVALAVSDSGCGLSEHVRAHLFEPFFTTKEAGKGTGLGLSTVYGIVKQSGGYLEVESAPGAGTTFTIYFPRVTETPEEVPLSLRRDSRAQDGETVLLVEDAEAVRRLATTILEQNGYRVIASPDGPSAIAAAAAHPGPIQILVTDMVMPGMSGGELARQLRTTLPGLKILFISGYAEEAVQSNGLLDEGAAFLAKPCSPQALTEKIRDILGKKSRT